VARAQFGENALRSFYAGSMTRGFFSVMEKHVVLIEPSPYDLSDGSKHFVSVPSMPLAIVALGSFLKSHGISVKLIDVQMDYGIGLTKETESAVRRRIVAHLCQQSDEILWIGLSCLAMPYAKNGLLLGREIKAALPGIPLVFGGYYASSHYSSLLQQHPFIDGVVCGDGEVAALEISHQLLKGQSLCDACIPNLVSRERASSSVGPEHLVSVDPENLPVMDFTLLPHLHAYPIGSMLTSRGCPFACAYCLEPPMRKYRPMSVAKLARELAVYEGTLSSEDMFIFDPLFGIGRQRTRELVEHLQQTRFNFILETRADVLDPTLVAELRTAGVECISLGIESASYSTLRRMNKIQNTAHYERYIDGARKIIEECFHNNITVFMGIMLGYPGDTLSDTAITLDFLASIIQLHDQVCQATGNAPGMVAFPNYVRVYPDTQLARNREQFQDTVFHEELIPGEYVVTRPSPDYSLADLQQHMEMVEKLCVNSPLFLIN
jgi:uncharacterized Fe-S cluster-containing radical SAM superfamily protein